MRTPRLIVGLVTAGLLGIAPLAVSAPAQAANVTTTASLALSGEPQVVAGDTISFSGEVAGVDAATGAPDSVTAGTVSLQVLTPSNPVWTTIVTEDTRFYFFSDIKVESNAQYKVVYSGATTTTDVFAPAESAPVAVEAFRKFVVKDKSGQRVQLTVKVTPDFGKKKLQVLTSTKKKGKFKQYKKFKTDAKGKVKFLLPRVGSGKVLYVRMIAKGNADYQTTVSEGSVS